jgi:hypothetical protein
LELRPDKSRIVVGTTNHGEDIVLYVSPDRPDAWKRGGFGKLVAEWQACGVVIWVSCEDVLQRL